MLIVDTSFDTMLTKTPTVLNTEAWGGLFSLDLVHPNTNGYKLLANAYIDAINELIVGKKFFGITTKASRYTLPK